MVDNSKQTLTNAAGIPVPSNTVSKSVGKQGPLLLEDYTLLDEAMTLLKYGVPAHSRPDPAALNTARRACSAFLKTLKSDYIEPEDYEPKLIPLELLKQN